MSSIKITKGVYAGSFDPITNGHLWMIKKGAKLFDALIIAIGVNTDKKCTFSLEERLQMIQDSTQDFPNVHISSFENQFLVDYAGSVEAEFILRGIRTGADYEYERGMRHINEDLNPGITTNFLMPQEKFQK